MCVCARFSCFWLHNSPSTSSTLVLFSIPQSSSFPLIRGLTFFLSKGSTVYIINMISSERSSLSIPLSVFPSLASSHDLPHAFFLSSLYFAQSDSFLWVYFYLPTSLPLSLHVFLSPTIPYMQSVLCWWELWLNVDKSGSSAGEKLGVGRLSQWTWSIYFSTFSSSPSPLSFSEGLCHNWWSPAG